MLATREFVKSQIEGLNQPLLSGPLLVIVHFKFPISKFLTTGKRQKMHQTPHFRRPDGDNLEKFLNDALNGVLWSDDSNISWLIRSKSRTTDKQGSTVVFAKEISMTAPDYDSLLSDIATHIKLDLAA